MLDANMTCRSIFRPKRNHNYLFMQERKRKDKECIHHSKAMHIPWNIAKLVFNFLDSVFGFQDKRKLEQILKKKQDDRAAELTRLQSAYKLEGDNKRILNLGWEELVQALQKRELSATAVLEAYMSKVC